MRLISDELYESLQKTCNGDYVNVETRNVLCSRDMSSFSEGSIGKWHRCTYNILNKADIHNTYDYHVNLSIKGIRSLIYSGDHDLSVPFLSTQAWIRSLNYSIVDDWSYGCYSRSKSLSIAP
ncbi:serine carboxypeptidase [Trifolium repens]|nr:serine carboxypeptidase [Trifolium repens]